MPSITDTVRAFLERYGQALSTGDLPAIVACWDVPALVLSDQGARAVLEATEVEAFFAGAVAWYHAQGIAATRPENVRVEPLSARIVSVDVTWAAHDAQGAAGPPERSRYVLAIADDGSPRIRVAMSLPVDQPAPPAQGT